jgi:hypothetical protein
MVQAIANGAANHQAFMDAMARTFTAGNDSTIGELRRTANMAARTRFGSTGFREGFQDPSNQVRHFTGGLIAGYRLGQTAGRIAMNSNEWGNDCSGPAKLDRREPPQW